MLVDLGALLPIVLFGGRITGCGLLRGLLSDTVRWDSKSPSWLHAR